MNLVYGLLVGIVMGVLLQRVRASSPGMILANLRLQNLSIIKFMALTIAVGMVVVYALSPVITMHMDIKPTYVVGVLVGGLIFGAGFAIGGYCPGTCVVGAGEGRRDAMVTIIGGVFGALAYALAYSSLEGVLIKPLSYGKITLPDVLHTSPVITAVVVAAIFLAAIRMMPTVRRVGQH